MVFKRLATMQHRTAIPERKGASEVSPTTAPAARLRERQLQGSPQGGWFPELRSQNGEARETKLLKFQTGESCPERLSEVTRGYSEYSSIQLSTGHVHGRKQPEAGIGTVQKGSSKRAQSTYTGTAPSGGTGGHMLCRALTAPRETCCSRAQLAPSKHGSGPDTSEQDPGHSTSK